MDDDRIVAAILAVGLFPHMPKPNIGGATIPPAPGSMVTLFHQCLGALRQAKAREPNP